jgi:hypothetical protein
VQRFPDTGRLAAAARDDPRPLGGEQPRRLEADPTGRAGHDAHTVAQAEIHGG